VVVEVHLAFSSLSVVLVSQTASVVVELLFFLMHLADVIGA
jgi:hypothetical protein